MYFEPLIIFVTLLISQDQTKFIHVAVAMILVRDYSSVHTLLRILCILQWKTDYLLNKNHSVLSHELFSNTSQYITLTVDMYCVAILLPVHTTLSELLACAKVWLQFLFSCSLFITIWGKLTFDVLVRYLKAVKILAVGVKYIESHIKSSS